MYPQHTPSHTPAWGSQWAGHCTAEEQSLVAAVAVQVEAGVADWAWRGVAAGTPALGQPEVGSSGGAVAVEGKWYTTNV